VETGVTSQQTATNGERPTSESAAAMAAPARMVYTTEEYLALERAAETKSEYRAGQIVAMAGASRAHNRIVLNLGSELSRQLRGSSCEAFVNDLRVRVGRTGLYTYPDVVVACGEIQFEDDQVDTLLNPVVVIEVLSPSSEAYDRGEKFAHYRRLDSLQEYLLVSQDKVRVERYVRHGDQWVLSERSSLEDVLRVDAIDCSVRLSDIYYKIELPSEDQATVPDAASGGTG
jgi:Uma2 family endonuclease